MLKIQRFPFCRSLGLTTSRSGTPKRSASENMTLRSPSGRRRSLLCLPWSTRHRAFPLFLLPARQQLQRTKLHLPGCDRHRPDRAVIVVPHFAHSGCKPPYADTIAAHDRVLQLTLRSRYCISMERVYLSPSWKIFPTSIPRLMRRCGLPQPGRHRPLRLLPRRRIPASV